MRIKQLEHQSCLTVLERKDMNTHNTDKATGIHIVPTIEGELLRHQAYRMNNRFQYASRGEDAMQNMGWRDLSLPYTAACLYW